MARYPTIASTRTDAMDLAGITHAVFRIGVGLLFAQHGVQKIFGLLGGEAVALDSMMGLAGLLELIGGALIVLGLLTRPVAVILAIEMVAAYFMAHHPRGGFPVQNGGELPLLFTLAFVYFAGNGAGPLSIDAALWRGRARGDTLGADTRRAA